MHCLGTPSWAWPCNAFNDMTVICSKCHHVRQPDDDISTPDWQCPSCGVVYAKAMNEGHSADHAARVNYLASMRPEKRFPWSKLFTVVAIVYALWVGLHGRVH